MSTPIPSRNSNNTTPYAAESEPRSGTGSCNSDTSLVSSSSVPKQSALRPPPNRLTVDCTHATVGSSVSSPMTRKSSTVTSQGLTSTIPSDNGTPKTEGIHEPEPEPELPAEFGSPKWRARSLSKSESLHSAPVMTFDKAHKIRRDEQGRKKINRYIVLDVLGKGAFSKVKLCQHELDGTYYAMKILSKSVLKSRGIGKSSALHKLRCEVAILKRLRHPHIIALQEVIDDPDSDKLYLILELAEHRELVTLDANNAVVPDEDGNNKIPERATRRLAAGLIDGIAFAHENGIAHRDIKPQNILLTDEDIPKLSDFGVSAIIDDSPLVTCTEGTISFLPPELLEQLVRSTTAEVDSQGSSWQGSFCAVPNSASFALPQGQPVNIADSPVVSAVRRDSSGSIEDPSFGPPVVDLFKADVWSLTLTIFVVCTGAHPWPEADDAVSLFEAMKQRPIRKILKERRFNGTAPMLSRELEDFLCKGLEPDPTARMTIFQAAGHPWIMQTKLPTPDQESLPAFGSHRSSALDVTVDEDDVANAVTVAHGEQSASLFPIVTPPRSFFIRKVPTYSAIHFLPPSDYMDRATSGEKSLSSATRNVSRSFAFDDSCVVQLRPDQLESHLEEMRLQQSLVLSFVASGSTTPNHVAGGSPIHDFPPPPPALDERSVSPAAMSNGDGSPPVMESPYHHARLTMSQSNLSHSTTPNRTSGRRGHSRTKSLPNVNDLFSAKVSLMGAPTPTRTEPPPSLNGSMSRILRSTTLPPMDSLEAPSPQLCSASTLNSSGREESERWEAYFASREEPGAVLAPESRSKQH